MAKFPKHRTISKGDRVATPHGVLRVLDPFETDAVTGESLVFVEAPSLPGYGRLVRLSDCRVLAN